MIVDYYHLKKKNWNKTKVINKVEKVEKEEYLKAKR